MPALPIEDGNGGRLGLRRPRGGARRRGQHRPVRRTLVDWHGWLFVDPSRSGGFEDHIGALEKVVGAYQARDLRTVVTNEHDVAANWKVVIENCQECYHCPMTHPELCEVSAPQSGENLESDGNWVGGWMELCDGAETMSLDGRSGGTTIARLDEHEQRTVMYVAVLPNLLISLHPTT